MRVLFFGDVVGALGRASFSRSALPLKKRLGADFLIVNGENATHGNGLSEKHYKILVDAGADCVTLGNHYRGEPSIDRYIDGAEKLVRPLNVIGYHHGVGSRVFDVNGIPLRVTNVMGRAFLKETFADPEEALTSLISKSEKTIHVIDFHADSTSEKAIFAHYFDGQVSAVVGTHTHVLSADARVLPKGTGFVTDAGMCGALEGVIGFNAESVIDCTVRGKRGHFDLDREGEAICTGVVMDFDETTFKCVRMESFQERMGRICAD